MSAFVEEQGISYPVAIDAAESTTKAFGVDSFPDYYLIDRAGKLRVADLANGDVDRALRLLLAEPAPVDPALAGASVEALRKSKRMLAIFGEKDEHELVQKLLRKERGLGKLVFNEFAVAYLDRDTHGVLARELEVSGDGAALVVLDATGHRLAALRPSELEADVLRPFLEEQRLPARNAESLYAAALQRAERENKRVLVHLGAPW